MTRTLTTETEYRACSIAFEIWCNTDARRLFDAFGFVNDDAIPKAVNEWVSEHNLGEIDFETACRVLKNMAEGSIG